MPRYTRDEKDRYLRTFEECLKTGSSESDCADTVPPVLKTLKAWRRNRSLVGRLQAVIAKRGFKAFATVVGTLATILAIWAFFFPRADQSIVDATGRLGDATEELRKSVKKAISRKEILDLNEALQPELVDLQRSIQDQMDQYISEHGDPITREGEGHLERASLHRIRLPESLVQRIVRLTRSFHLYSYSPAGGGPPQRPLSPERGHLFRWLLLSPVELTPIFEAGADFTYADLDGAVVDRPIYSGSPSSWIEEFEQNLSDSLRKLTGQDQVLLQGVDLAQASLAKGQLEHVRFVSTNVADADLREARLRFAAFVRCKMQRCDLRDADLAHSSFFESSLAAADLRCADLEGASFYFTDLRGASLDEADLEDADLTDAVVEKDWLEMWSAEIQGIDLHEWETVFVPIDLAVSFQLGMAHRYDNAEGERGYWVLRRRNAPPHPLLDEPTTPVTAQSFIDDPRALGFLPLGKNCFGIEEFEHLESSLRMVLIPAGTFQMGSVGLAEDESPVRTIELDSFLIAKHEVRQREWEAVLGGDSLEENTSSTRGQDLPVDVVSWVAAREYCEAVNLSLPTEAQWEFACRSGTSTTHSFGDGVHRLQANFGRLLELAHEGRIDFDDFENPPLMSVDRGRPNRFGIYNMHGNVAEWCFDVYDADLYAQDRSILANPVSRYGSRSRVHRGGHWMLEAAACRSAARNQSAPQSAFISVGLRPVFPLTGTKGRREPPAKHVELTLQSPPVTVGVSYQVQGEGPPLLLVHGVPGSKEDYTETVMDRLSTCYEVLAPDLLGYGGSTAPDGLHANPTIQANMLAALCDEVGISKPLLVGHGLGSLTVLTYALEHRENVAGVVLLAPVVYPDSELIPPWVLSIAQSPPGQPPQLNAVDVMDEMRLGDRFHPMPVDAAFRDRVVRALEDGTSRRQLVLDFLMLGDGTLDPFVEAYGRLSAPIFVASGAQDTYVSSKRHSTRLLELLQAPGGVSAHGSSVASGHMITYADSSTIQDSIGVVEAQLSALRAVHAIGDEGFETTDDYTVEIARLDELLSIIDQGTEPEAEEARAQLVKTGNEHFSVLLTRHQVAGLLNNRGLIYSAEGKGAEAIADYRESVRRYEALMNAKMYGGMDDTVMFRLPLEGSPVMFKRPYAKCLNNLGRALLQEGLLDESVRMLTGASALLELIDDQSSPLLVTRDLSALFLMDKREAMARKKEGENGEGER